MNFVQLVERLRVECGVSGSPITDVETLTGEYLRLRNWTASAWVDIQTEHEGQWGFMRVSSTHLIGQYQSILSPAEWAAGRVNTWKIDSFRIAASGDPRSKSDPVDFLPYDQFVAGPGLDVSEWAKPRYFTIRPGDKALIVAPGADAAYTLFYEYQSEPIEMEDNVDVPACPSKFHMVIVYEAMLKYGRYEMAPEILSEARADRDRLLFRLKLDQLPSITFGGPLA